MRGGLMNIPEKDGNVILSGVKCLDIPLCLDCGQAFRFSERADGGFHGVAFGEILDVKKADQGGGRISTSTEIMKKYALRLMMKS